MSKGKVVGHAKDRRHRLKLNSLHLPWNELLGLLGEVVIDGGRFAFG